MILCSLFSGGKDSTYALHWAVSKGFKMAKLVTFIPSRQDSWLFQYPNVRFTNVHSRVLGIPLVMSYLEGVRGEEEKKLRSVISDACGEADGIVTGAILSDYQRMRINEAAEYAGLKVFSPLWRKDQGSYLKSLIREGFRFYITSISAYGLPLNLLGKEVNEEIVQSVIELSDKYGFNPAFEGGEAETYVFDAPLFRKVIYPTFECKVTGANTGSCVIQGIRTGEKSNLSHRVWGHDP